MKSNLIIILMMILLTIMIIIVIISTTTTMSQNWSVLAQSTTFMVSGWVMGEK